MTSAPVAAAIDIGSNSIKMTVARFDNGAIEQIAWESEVVRLGHDIERTGVLNAERIELGIETLGRFAERARELGATRIVAVATEATRAAANGQDFLHRITAQTGIDVRVIDGMEEAALTFRGVATEKDIAGRVVIADIGGASTELIVANDGVMLGARSIPLGSGRLTDRIVASDPPALDELAASEAEAGDVVQRAAKSLKLPRGEEARLIVVGGTGEYMARLVPDETRIDLKAVKNVLAKLAVLTAAELADAITIPEARARVLPAGVAIVAAIANRVQPTWVEIARGGIRTGLLAEIFAERDGESSGDATLPAPREGTPDGPAETLTAGEDGDRARGEPEFRDVMRGLIAERWAVVRDTIPGAIVGDSIEGVHDVRVASRRLRAAMDIGEPIFPRAWYKPLHRTAKTITSALGEVRDRDVLLESLRAERDAAPLAERPGIDRMIAHVEGERVVARQAMERYLEDLLASPLWGEVERRFGPGVMLEAPRRAVERR